MKEIKFRAWDILTRKMKSWGDIFDLPAWEIFPGTPEQRPYEVMQYTGLKDKNGVEIHEGDLVQVEGLFPNDPFKVWFRDGLFHIGNWNTQGFMNAFDFYEVVGNIYENPELLETKKD